MPSETLETSRKVDSLLVENARITEHVKSLEERLKEQEDFSRGSRAQLKLDLESIKDEINSLKEILREESTSNAFRRTVPSAPSEVDTSAKNTEPFDSTGVASFKGIAQPGSTHERETLPDTVIASRQSTSNVKKLPSDETKGVQDTSRKSQEGSIPPAAQLYRQAYLYYNRGDYDLALEELDILSDNYSNDPICEDALFLKGECFFQKKSFFDAINQFSTLLSRFPKGKKVPGALLRMALAYESVGENDLALGVAKRLLREYPYSEEAATAKGHFAGLE